MRSSLPVPIRQLIDDTSFHRSAINTRLSSAELALMQARPNAGWQNINHQD
jgi:hypothetical protein